MELLARISKGTNMDQIYLPKSRPPGLEAGVYVRIEPVQKKTRFTPYYCNVRALEPLKIQVIQDIFDFIQTAENILITGSFLEKGFQFNDIDIVLINSTGAGLRLFLKEKFGLETHIISMNYDTLRTGLNTDPLFQMLLNKFVAKKRVFFNIKPELNYKLLDLHLLKSELLIDNFDYLSGNEKYKLVRNLFAIKIFIAGTHISQENVNKEIERYFGKGTVDSIRSNIVQKASFIKKYKNIYQELSNKILSRIKNEKSQ